MRRRRILSSLFALILVFAQLIEICAVPVSALAEEHRTDREATGSALRSPSEITYGDINGDGRLNSTDVELLARYLADDTTVTIDSIAADVTNDDVVDLKDLLYLVKFVKGDSVSLGETVTVTFETNGGEDIAPVTLVLGGTVRAPEARKDNAIFLGWYSDESLTVPFYGSDPITENITVYAKYQEVSGQTDYLPSAYALQDQSPDLYFDIVRVSGELRPQDAVTLRNADGFAVPELEFTQINENQWRITARGGYTEGASYRMILADGYNFNGKNESIREASFYIFKEEIVNFTTNNDIIYIQDTEAMNYTLSDGSVCEMLTSAVLYNSEDVASGSFTYDGQTALSVGDTVCIYANVHPNERDYINENYKNDPASYIVVESIDDDVITFRGMSMQGEESDVEKLISLPSTIPFSVLNLPEGDGTVEAENIDTVALYAMYGTNVPETVKVGDFLVFYVGSFGSIRESDPVSYKKVIQVDGTTITYVSSSQEELKNAINLFLSEGVDGDTMLEGIDQNALEQQVIQQVTETGFAEDAVQYLSSVVMSSQEFLNYVAENKIIVYDENGMQLTEEQVKAYGLGHSFELGDDVEIGFNVTTCDGENSHFDDGLKVTLQISAEFEVDIGKGGKMGSLKIELGAAFTQEVYIDVNINANADITWVLFIPVIHDIVFSSAVDVMSYTGISLEAKFYTQEPSEDFFDKLKEAWGDKLSKKTLEKIEAFKKKYDDKFGKDSLGEDIEGFWEAQTNLIEELIKNGELTKDDAISFMESTDELNVMEDFYNNIGMMNDEDYGAGIVELAERYSDMLSEEDNGWLELCKVQIFEVPINLFLFEINIEGSFVVRANINVALGANLEYEVGKRYINWFSIFGKGSGSSEIDLIDEKFAFQFYAMGYIGLKTGILVEIKAGIVSTKIGYVGISAEFGAYAELYGYFMYTYTKQRPIGSNDWEEEESVIGALYFEFGLYLDINLNASLLSILEKEWELYSGKWALLSAGSRENVYGFATELKDGEKIVIEDEDGNSNNGILCILADSFRSMNTLDMTSGEQDTPVKPWISYYEYSFLHGDDYSLTDQKEDKINFTYTLSSQHFSLVPVYEYNEKEDRYYLTDYKVQVDVPEGVHYLSCDLRLVWCLDKLCWSKYDIALTIPLVWTDLADEELSEYKTATVKVGNEAEGYRTVWTERYLKGERFELPTAKKILNYAGYAGDNDVQYSGYTGYTVTNRGEEIKSSEQQMYFDTVYYFDMTARQYTITIQGVENSDGTLADLQFTAKYGEKFDFSPLLSTGTNRSDKYTVFAGIEARDSQGNATLRDVFDVIGGNYASELLDGDITYHAKYVNNSGVVTYKFTGIALDPITKLYKNGTMPSQDDFIDAVRTFDETAYIALISPVFESVNGDIVYTVTVKIPEKPLKSYTITYETNGGSSIAASHVVERSALTQPQSPSKEGYSFAGWFYDKSLTEAVDWNRTMPSMDFTLYAKWRANNYKITLNAGEGYTPVASINTVYDQKIGSLPTATRTNYIFLGWFDAISGGTQYTEDTVYKTAGTLTLYAHWQLKATISTGDISIDAETVTYDGSTHKPTISCGLDGVEMSSLVISYRRQTLDRNWSTELPKNAGTYDIRIQRAEDGKYLAFEYTYIGKLVIEKRSRTVSESGLTAESFYASIKVTGVPTYEGDGTQMFAVEKYNGSKWVRSDWQASAGFMNLASGNYRVCFKVAEGENYLESNTVTQSGQMTINTLGSADFKSMSFTLASKTCGSAFSNTLNPVYARFRYIDGSEGSKVKVSGVGVLGKTGKDTLTAPTDPWVIAGIQYSLDGGDAWKCELVELRATVGGTETVCYYNKVSGGIFELEDSSSTVINVSSYFKRKITSVGNFNTPESLNLSGSNGLYTYTYDGKVIDQFSSWTNNGYYNCYAHTYAPSLTFACSTPEVNGYNYAQYFRSSINTLTIDRDALYKAMVRDGLTSITATATLTFDTASTASGNVWTKTFNITLPDTVAVSEDMANYNIATDANVTVNTKEDNDYVTIILGLDENPGIWAIKNTISFDTSKLSLEQVTVGSLASAYEIASSTKDGKYTILAYRNSVKESYQTGSLVVLTFKKLTETVEMQTALTIEPNQTINDQAETPEVDTAFDIGDFTSVPPVDHNKYMTDSAEIIDAIYAALSNRQTDVLTLPYATTTLVSAEDISLWFHTAANALDSYARLGIQRYTATAQKYTKEDVYYYTLTYAVEYYTTDAQEAAFETKLQQVIAELNLSGKSDLEKILAIYGYVCDNVTYDLTAEHCFTAYGALIDGKAVCQGYALLLMRMLDAVGIESEVVFGVSEDVNHMWNLVKLDGAYFLLDATWDSTDSRECYFWLLKGTDGFDHHTPAASYPIGTSKHDHEDALGVSHAMAEPTCEAPATCAKCGNTVGEALGHLDANRDHTCDRNCCNSTLGEHFDSPDDDNHVCDYGCGAILEPCSGATPENGYICVICMQVAGTIELKAAIAELNALNAALQQQIDAHGDSLSALAVTLAEKYASLIALIGTLPDGVDSLKEYVDAANAALSEADKALQAAINQVANDLAQAKIELQNAIDANKAELEEKVAQLDEAYKVADALINSQIASLKSEELALRQSITNLEAAMNDADAALDKAIQAVQQNLDEAKAELQYAISTKADTATLIAKVEELYAAITTAEQVAKAYAVAQDTALKQQLDADIAAANDLIASLEQRVSAAETAILNLLKAIEALKDVDASNARALEEAIQNLTAAIETAKEFALTADTELRLLLEDAIATAKTEAMNAASEALEQAKAELNALIAQGDAANAEQLAAAIKKLNEAIALAQEAAQQFAADADQVIKQALEAKITAAQAALQEAINHVQSELEKTQEQLEQAIAELNALIALGDAANAEQLAAAIKKLNEAIALAQEAAQQFAADADQVIKQALEAKIAAAQAALQETINHVQSELEKTQEQLEQAIAELRQAIADGNSNLAAEIDALNKALETAKYMLEQADAQNKAELIAKIEAADAALSDAIQNVQKKLEEAQKALNDAIETGDAALSEEIAALNEALTSAQAALEAADAENRASLEEQITIAMNSLSTAISRVQSNLDQAVAELRQEIARSQATLRDQITALNTALDNAISAYQAADDSLKAELTAQIETAADTLHAAIQAVQKNLDEAKAELNKAIADGEAELDGKIAALNDALASAKAALEAADATNKSELTAQIDEAYETLQTAINNLASELDNVKQKLESKDAELAKATADNHTFIIIVCVISSLTFCGCATLAVFFILDKKKKSNQ